MQRLDGGIQHLKNLFAKIMILLLNFRQNALSIAYLEIYLDLLKFSIKGFNSKRLANI